ncbi:MAG: exopolysaccharide biosynthesis polyprenyl glycosylphosphotransferase [Proteobacteria bacterium]|nr:exopolysaccharide biosynthesis polyprenyl glycosylphosphotransferase [Pseudomonadota bacterium]
MDVTQLKWEKHAEEHSSSTSLQGDEMHDYYYHLYDFYDENSFNRKLYIERKRTERSKKPFLLMLINIENVLQTDKDNQVLKKIVSTLFTATRDIDVKGWYQYRAVVGIFYSEIKELNEDTKTKIFHKVQKGLNAALDQEQLEQIEISLRVFPKELEEKDADDTFHLNLYVDSKKETPKKKFSLTMKKIIDFFGSFAAIIIFSPFFIFIPILIKLTSEGPALFKQKRVGMWGKQFTFLKFRSMYVGNNEDTHKEYINKFISGEIDADGDEEGAKQSKVFKIKTDPRVTPIGKFIRKTSIDELPQFFNVLKGDMSLVGPRPPIPYEFKQYDIWHRRRIMEMKPGITGLWQIRGRSATTFDDMVRLDLQYIEEWSPWLDIKILLKTPLVVLTLKGAY